MEKEKTKSLHLERGGVSRRAMRELEGGLGGPWGHSSTAPPHAVPPDPPPVTQIVRCLGLLPCPAGAQVLTLVTPALSTAASRGRPTSSDGKSPPAPSVASRPPVTSPSVHVGPTGHLPAPPSGSFRFLTALMAACAIPGSG